MTEEQERILRYKRRQYDALREHAGYQWLPPWCDLELAPRPERLIRAIYAHSIPEKRTTTKKPLYHEGFNDGLEFACPYLSEEKKEESDE